MPIQKKRKKKQRKKVIVNNFYNKGKRMFHIYDVYFVTYFYFFL